MRTNILTLVLAATTASAATADDKQLFSGPQPGERLTPFKVIQVTGAETAKTVSIANPKDKGATLLVFLHKLTEPAIGSDFFTADQRRMIRDIFEGMIRPDWHARLRTASRCLRSAAVLCVTR